jgi:hypothetical protein
MAIIKLAKILFIPEIYPRVEVYQHRIDYFVDMIESGKEVPPP